jgi:aminopeptidase N
MVMPWMAVVLMVSAQLPPASSNTGEGVPLTLARDRAERVRELRYDLHFRVPGDVKAPVGGTVRIGFTLTEATRPLVLDFAGAGVQKAAVNGRPATLDVVPDHVIVPAADLRQGANEVVIDFTAGDGPLNRNEEFLYTLFVPARARQAFPCFDQPDLKAKFGLTLDVPRGWEALSNGEEITRTVSNEGTRLAFADTQKLSTYLFAFAAGRFKVEMADRAGRRFRMFHRETDAEKVARNRDAIFDLHAAALAWLERYTDIPYPFGKFDFLLVPSFQFGGMEHAGAIFYNGSALLLDPSATQNQKLRRASLIAHETSHMWFGDLVTMKWFDDVWMKEVFANFMAAKIVNPTFPDINHELRFLLAHYPAAYDVDRTEGTNPIRQPLDNLNEAGSLYGAIIYEKAPVVMRQLEMILGEDGLKEGLRAYLRGSAFGNAAWPDLIDLLDRRTPEDLRAWSRAWVTEPGRPDLRTAIRVQNGRITSLVLTQHDQVAGRNLLWNQRIKLALGYDEEIRTLDVRLNRFSVEVTEARGLPAPRYVLPTGGGIGYGGFTLDAVSREYLLRQLASIPDALTRGSAAVTLWEEMLDGRVTSAALLDTFVAALPGERDELNVQQFLSYIQKAYWKFTDAQARAARAPDLERLLRKGLDLAPTPSLKSAWFSALRDTTLTVPTLEWLEGVWRKSTTVPGLVLAEPDFILLAQDLVVRAVPNWKAILDDQLTRIENPDRKARFAFVQPALSSDPAVRAAFFASLKDVQNRRREPWVLEALTYLHHPLRASSSEPYIPPSLAMLREIQRTGDIFFPKRWMDATLSGHSSASAAQIVRTFVAGLEPDYPARLRRVVLSAADDLYRATRTPR